MEDDTPTGSAPEEDEQQEVTAPPSHEFSFTSFINEFCDFLTVAVHTIIYEREIYPGNLFIQARKYNHPVRQARHPRLCSWIQDAVEACRSELLKCAVAKICVIMVAPSTNQVVERFVFDVSEFPVIPPDEVETPLFGPGNTAVRSQTVLEIEEQYRAAIMKLSLCPPRLGKLPTGCTFSMSIELKEDYQADENGDISLSWISVEPKGKRAREPSESSQQKKVKTIPIRKISSDSFPIELWIEKNDNFTEKKKP